MGRCPLWNFGRNHDLLTKCHTGVSTPFRGSRRLDIVADYDRSCRLRGGRYIREARLVVGIIQDLRKIRGRDGAETVSSRGLRLVGNVMP